MSPAPGDPKRSTRESCRPAAGRTRRSRRHEDRTSGRCQGGGSGRRRRHRHRGAAFTVGEARAAIAARGRFIMAVSGGHSPWRMLRVLADERMPWADVHVVQVDERVAPAGHPDRNLTHLRESLLAHCPLPPENVHPMPVELADLDSASDEYAATLQQIAGAPALLDLAH